MVPLAIISSLAIVVVAEAPSRMSTHEPPLGISPLLFEMVVVAHLEFAAPAPAQPVQLVTVRFPIAATFALKLVVEARPETKKSEEVAFCKVLEARIRRLFTVEEAVEIKPLLNSSVVEVAFCNVEEPRARKFVA